MEDEASVEVWMMRRQQAMAQVEIGSGLPQVEKQTSLIAPCSGLNLDPSCMRRSACDQSDLLSAPGCLPMLFRGSPNRWDMAGLGCASAASFPGLSSRRGGGPELTKCSPTGSVFGFPFQVPKVSVGMLVGLAEGLACLCRTRHWVTSGQTHMPGKK
jgi:hypothetical protein